MKRGETNHHSIAVYLVLAAALIAVAGCRTPAGRTSGEVVDDTAITSKIKAKLTNEDALQGLAVDVDTFEGNVTLTGAVKTPEQKERAEEVAKSVYGVRAVNNLLMIRES